MPDSAGASSRPTHRLGSPRGGFSTRMTRIPSAASRMVRKGSVIACSMASTVSRRKRSGRSVAMAGSGDRALLGQMNQDAEGIARVDKGLPPDFPLEGHARRVGVAGDDAPSPAFQLGHGGIQVVHFEGDVVHAWPAMRLEKARHRTVGPGGLEQLEGALAQAERSVADAHVFDVLLGLEVRAEPA